jgi:spore photoproduct lyase
VIRQIYIEEAVRDHPRTAAIVARYPEATTIACAHYGEVFNPGAQSFRLQKKSPSLILAHKNGSRVIATPEGYGVGGERNFYFSHMYNCVYDCRYCFLQGMYRSAHYVVFVNYDDFFADIAATTAAGDRQPSWFFSGYDCDSLAMEPVTGFIEAALPVFTRLPQAQLEIRTKSTQIRSLSAAEPIANCVVAFSFTPDEISRAVEHKVPSVDKRIRAMEKLQRQGWRIGLRLDPLIYTDGFERQYRQLIESLFARIDADSLHSVSVGEFRLPKDFFRKMVRIYPREKLFAGPLEQLGGQVSYPESIETSLRDCVLAALREHVEDDRIFLCA